MNSLVLILFIFLSFNLYAQRRDVDDLVFASFTNDPSEALRAARDIIRENGRRSSDALAQTQPQHGICVNCEEILALTSNVQDILREQGLAPQEVEQLVVVSQYLRFVDNEGNQRCHEVVDEFWSNEFTLMDPENAIMIDRGELDLDRVLSWRISGRLMQNGARAGDTYFLRGRGDDKNIFIRLDFPNGINGNPVVTTYKLINFDENMAETALEQRVRRYNLPDVTPVDENPLAGIPRNNVIDAGASLYQSETSSLHLGPSIEIRNYLPRDVSLLDFRTTQSLNEDTNLQVSGEISARNTHARFSLVGTHGEGERVWIQAEAGENVQVGIPYTFSYDQVPITGSVIATSQGVGGSLSYRNNDTARTQASVIREEGRTRFNIDHRRRLSENSTIMFRVTNEDGRNTSWLLYRYALD